MLYTKTLAVADAPLSLAVMHRHQLIRDCLARVLSQASGLAVVGSCESIAGLEAIVVQRRPKVAIVESAENPDMLVPVLVSRLAGTRILLLTDRGSPDLEQRARQAGAAGCVSSQESLIGLELALRRIAGGQATCAGHDGAQLSEGQLLPAAIEFASANHAHGDGLASAELRQLTRRELDVWLHMAQGYTVKQCAEALGISPSTADNHKSRLMRKLRVHKTVDLARLALRCGLSQQLLGAVNGAGRIGMDPPRASAQSRSR